MCSGQSINFLRSSQYGAGQGGWGKLSHSYKREKIGQRGPGGMVQCPQSSSSHNLTECLEHADEDIFPKIRTLLRIGCTLPVGSCDAERSFPCLRRVKTYLCNRIGEDRLSGLIVMNMNHGMEIDLEAVCQMFIERNKWKMFSSYILYQ